MGDRISIQFECDGEKSIYFFHHWAGTKLLVDVKGYVRNLDLVKPKSQFDPINRREPTAIMADFIGWYQRQHPSSTINGNVRVGMECDGDNSDNGNYIWSFDTNGWI